MLLANVILILFGREAPEWFMYISIIDASIGYSYTSTFALAKRDGDSIPCLKTMVTIGVVFYTKQENSSLRRIGVVSVLYLK